MHLSYTQDLEECKLDMNEIAELIDTKPIAEVRYSGDVNNLLK